MLVAKYLTRPTACHKRYLKGRLQWPIPPPAQPLSYLDTLWERVKLQCPLPQRAAYLKKKCWLSDNTIELMDARCSLRKNPRHSRADARRLTRAIATSLKADRKARTVAAGLAIQAALEGPQPSQRAAYQHLQKWYKFNSGRTFKPSRQDLESRTTAFATLYTAEDPSPPGDPIPIHVNPAPIDDSIPTPSEIRAATSRLKNHKATGPSAMRAEYIKQWLHDAFPQDFHTGEGDPPAPDPEPWDNYCLLIRHMFDTGQVPTELHWQILACLPKPDGGTRGIGLIEVAWKHVEAIIDNRVKAVVRFHDMLHGFTPCRGTGTAIIEAKLQQELAHLQRRPLFQIYLDLKKAFDSLDRPRTLDILRGYGMGPRLLKLLETFWNGQRIVCRQSKYHGEPFTATRGIIQGGLFSTTIFNIVVDAVGRDWLTKTFPDPAPLVSNGLGMQVADKLAGFYADDGLLSATDAVWLQFALEQLVAIFRRVGLKANATKTQAMICYPTAIPTAYSEAAYLRRTTGVGPTSKERRREKIQCPSCDTSLARASLRQHLQSVHGEELLPSTLHLTQPVGPPQLYTTSIPITDPVSCPVPNCPHRITGRATQTTRSYNMRKHFMYRHPQHSLCLRNEGSEPLLRCDRCDMHVGALALNTGHYRTKLCLHGAARKARRALAANVQDARTRTFHIGTTDLEKVEVFRYLGRMMAAGNSDWPAVYKNLRKARSKWGQISKPLIGTGVPPRTIGYFYKAIVQAVLLYGCKTWVVTPAMLRALSGFHNRMARRIANRMPRLLSNGD